MELIKTNFKSPLISEPVTATRGRYGEGLQTECTFPWTAAVRALTIFLLKAAAKIGAPTEINQPIIEGLKGSVASSLDAAIYKDNAWFALFGINSRGECLSKKIFHRINPGRRRAGPVMISLNEKVLPASAIEVYLDNQRVQDPAKLKKFANELEDRWLAKHEPVKAAA